MLCDECKSKKMMNRVKRSFLGTFSSIKISFICPNCGKKYNL